MPSTKETNGLGAHPEDWLPAGLELRENDAEPAAGREVTVADEWPVGPVGEEWADTHAAEDSADAVAEGPAAELQSLDDVWQAPHPASEVEALRAEVREAELRARKAEERAKKAEQKLERERKRAEAVKRTRKAIAERSKAPVKSAAKKAAADDRVNLNEASFEALRALGMTVNQAARFIGQRDERGGFRSIEDLDSLYGLARSVVEDLKLTGTV